MGRLCHFTNEVGAMSAPHVDCGPLRSLLHRYYPNPHHSSAVWLPWLVFPLRVQVNVSAHQRVLNPVRDRTSFLSD